MSFVADPRSHPLRLLAGLLLLALPLGGCPRCEPDPPPPPESRHADTAGACSGERWIGVLAVPGPCPTVADAGGTPVDLAVEGWEIAPLFPPEGDPVLQPEPLRRFCRYDAPPTPGAATPEAFLGPGGELPPGSPWSALERDCRAVVPAAEPYLPVEPLEERFALHAGAADLPAANGAVRLAIVDTAPTEEDSPQTTRSNSPHGGSLVHLARRLLCDGSDGCVAQVTTRLALPWLLDTYGPPTRQDTTNGGHVGWISQLAEAIHGEVSAWAAAAGAGEPTAERLVLNLSVGWEPELFGGLEADAGQMPAPVQAVLAALEDATCRGVLAVAAAGNRGWGPDAFAGPLLPAGWEERPAPASCGALLAPAAAPDLGDAGYRPLLFAAGAVDAAGRELANARFDATPRLLAYGDHAAVALADGQRVVVDEQAPTGRTPALTGSSVAALVVSASAAAAWSADPTIPLFDLVERLHARATAAGGPGAPLAVDRCLPGSPSCADPPRIVRLCDALGEPCAQLLEPGFPDVAAPEAIQVDLDRSDCDHDFEACAPDAVRDLLAAEGTGELGQERFHWGGELASPPQPCPHWQYPSTLLEAWVGPQPGSDPCPHCGFGGSPDQEGSGAVHLEIDPLFPREIAAAVLVVGADAYRLDEELAAGSRLVVRGIEPEPDDRLFLAVALADEEGSLDRAHSAVSPLLRWP